MCQTVELWEMKPLLGEWSGMTQDWATDWQFKFHFTVANIIMTFTTAAKLYFSKFTILLAKQQRECILQMTVYDFQNLACFTLLIPINPANLKKRKEKRNGLQQTLMND